MARKKRESVGSNWMDTYGDMVTLLLCFFVLLYSMSSVDEEKWKAMIQSFNPDAVEDARITSGNEGPTADNVDGEPDAEEMTSINQLYEMLQNYVGEQGAQDEISLSKGEGFVFLSMDNTVFFDGDSYTLRPEGQLILDDLSVILSQASGSIDEIRILGHTAQATGSEPNDPTVDRFLASNRATVVLVYLQEKNFIDPARLVSIGYGQWRPISSNDTPEERADNRRVEFIISGKDLDGGLPGGIEEYYTMSGQGQPGAATDTATPSEGSGQLDTTVPGFLDTDTETDAEVPAA